MNRTKPKNQSWEKYLQTRKISPQGQLSIPKHIREKLGIEGGQLIKIVARDGRIILTPIKNIG